jgi:hypothetical protein
MAVISFCNSASILIVYDAKALIDVRIIAGKSLVTSSLSRSRTIFEQLLPRCTEVDQAADCSILAVKHKTEVDTRQRGISGEPSLAGGAAQELKRHAAAKQQERAQ